MTLTDIFNPLMIFLLRSPFHMLASKSTLLITFIGRRSGRSYTTPVNYVGEGDIIYIVSHRDRTWWRNLRGRTPVSLRLKGKDLKAAGDVIEDSEKVAGLLMEYLQKVSRYARYFNVGLDRDGHPIPDDVTRAAEDRIMVILRTNK